MTRMFSNQTSRTRKVREKVAFFLFRLAAFISGLGLFLILFALIRNGADALSWEFISQPPKDAMTEGGILTCIVGTIYLSAGSILVALPWGMATAVYLNEYARPGPVVRTIRMAINNLAGVPSIIFGLFGLAFFVVWMDFGISILSGVLTLSILILPVIIGASEEALRAIPMSFREASLGLGASRWQTLIRVVLPQALPGMMTGSILGVSRAAGETAAIMFTGAVFFSPKLPSSIFDAVMALPYHVYVLATSSTDIEKTRVLQYGTALILVVLVLGLNLSAIWIRSRMQRNI